MQTSTSKHRAAIIGDLVASRQRGERAGIQATAEAALARVNARFDPEQPFRFTVGDEFQGVMPTVEQGVLAAAWIRLETTGAIGVRMGIGWGELEILDASRNPILQDGPCWWRARQAIKLVSDWEAANQKPSSTATLAITNDEREGRFNAGLILVDYLLSGFDQTDAVIARMVTDGHSQDEAADHLGVNKSSVSRRMQRHGITAFLAAQRMFQ
jgi:hypothetical protein